MATTSLLMVTFSNFLLGVILCFFGYGLIRSLAWVYGFLFGAGFGVGMVSFLDPVAAAGVYAASILIFGFFFGWLCASLHALPVILMGLFTGVFIVLRFLTPEGARRPDLLLLLVSAVIGAVVAYALKRYVVIGWSAVFGAALIINAFLHFLPGLGTETVLRWGGVLFAPSIRLESSTMLLLLVIFLALTITGIVFQYWNTKDLAYQEKHFNR
jgi:hypothetical protein